MHIVRRLAALPALAAIWLLAACSGASTGKVDPNAGIDAADKGAQFAIANGKLVAVAIVILAVGWFVGWLMKNKAIQILAAMAIAGTIVYLVVKGGR